MNKDFSHLHVHSHYSLLDGYGTTEDIVSRVSSIGQTAAALTDHGNIHGAIDFYRTCKKYDVKPIIGLEGYITSFGTPRTQKDAGARQNHHILILAATQDGYQNILNLTSTSWLDGFYYRPRMDYDVLEKYKSGLVVTSGCMAAEISDLILKGASDQEIEKLFSWYVDVFGENFFVELQHHPGIPEIVEMNKKLIYLARRYNVKMVATNDAHYANPKDASPHDILLCIQTGARVASPNRMRFTDNEYYLKSRAEMEKTFNQYGLDDSIFDNTLLISDMCNCNPEYSKGINHIPHVNIDIGAPIDDSDDILRYLVYNVYLDAVYPDYKNNQEVLDRVEYELGVIKRTGFANYYLIIKKICAFAKDNDIEWNIRGSGTGSIICYILGMSFIDPLEHGLLFERFLNESRVTIPDLDLDFEDSRRNEIIEYLIKEYGQDSVAQVVTFGHMKARMAVRDVGRVLGYPQEFINELSKKIQNIPGKPITIDNSLAQDSEYHSKDLLDAYESDYRSRGVIDSAKAIENKIRHTGVHAAAVMVGDRPLIEYTGLMRGGSSAVTSHITQYDYPTLESIGLLKIDCLGLATLTIIKECCRLIKERHGILLDPKKIPYEDKSSFDILSTGETVGIFQVESHGLRKALMQMQPNTFQHIMDVISLYRPGPIQYIPSYIARLHGNEQIEYLHPSLVNHTRNTQGIVIYQEQIINILSDIAGYTRGEADLVRKGISKKDPKIIQSEKERFIYGAEKSGLDQQQANQLWSDIEKFTLYGFNACISGKEKFYRNTNQFENLSISEMYNTMNDREWAKKNGYLQLHYKYRKNGYGYALSMSGDGRIHKNKIVDIRYAGNRLTYTITTDSGRTISVTDNHKFPTTDGEKIVSELEVGDGLYSIGEYEESKGNYNFYNSDVPRNYPKKGQQGFQKNSNGNSVEFERIRNKCLAGNYPCSKCGKYKERYELHHIDGNRTNNSEENLRWLCVSCHKKIEYQLGRTKAYEKGIPAVVERIVSIEPSYFNDVFDIEMQAPDHNFVVQSGIVTCNSHASSYARLTMQTAWLKANYPIEFMAACLYVEGEKADKVIIYVNECQRMGIKILTPKLATSGYNFSIVNAPNSSGELTPYSRFIYDINPDEAIQFGFISIKNVGEKLARLLADSHYKSMMQINPKFLNKKSFEALAACEVFEPEYSTDQILSDIDSAYEQTKKYQKSVNSGQTTIISPQLFIDSTKEIDRYALEKQYLGLWVNHHPVSAYESLLESIPNRTTDVNEDNLNKEMYIVCAISELKEVEAKKGKMAFVVLSDKIGQCEAIIFPKTYAELDVKEDDVVMVRGMVRSTRGDVPTLIVDAMVNNLAVSAKYFADKSPEIKEEEPIPVVDLHNKYKLVLDLSQKDDLPDIVASIEESTVSAEMNTVIQIFVDGEPRGVLRYRGMAIDKQKAIELGLTLA